MTFHKYRSSILFSLGLCLASGMAMSIDAGLAYSLQPGLNALDLTEAPEIAIVASRDLTAADAQAAHAAWGYIAGNTRPETGLVDSVEGFPSTTLWDQGSYLFALVAAARLDVIDRAEFETRVETLLTTFKNLPLFEGTLPNKVYNTVTLEMVDYRNTASEEGIGWSALDIGRMLMALRALEKLEPNYGPSIRDLLAFWDLGAMAKEGELWGGLRKGAEVLTLQEGRIGYEQYAARAAAMWGLDALTAASAGRILDWTEVDGAIVPRDRRQSSTFQAITPVLSEPYILQALELGWDSESRLLAERVYRAQENRYELTQIPTAVSEDHIDQAPFFLYSSVFSNGRSWAVVAENGDFHDDLRTLSVKASFAWDAIFDTEYTDFLRQEISSLANAERGWPAGIYESDQSVNEVYTLNTNAIVLEAIHYMAHGPFWAIK